MATCQPHGLIPIRRTQSRKVEHTLPFVLRFNVITPRRYLEYGGTVEQHGQQITAALFWVATQPVVQFVTDVSGQRIGPILRVQPPLTA